MKTIQQRLNNIKGQIDGVNRMINKRVNCVEVLTQLKAIKSAISSVMNTIVEGQFDECAKSLTDKDKKLLIKIKNYVKSS